MAERKTFLERRAEAWAREGLTMDPEALEAAGLTGHTPSARPIGDERVEVGAQAVDLTRTIGDGPSATTQTVGRTVVETAAPDFRERLWVPDQRRPGHFRPRVVLQNMVAPCLGKRDKQGRRIFFTKDELDLRFPDWKPYTVEDLPLGCFVENCPKRFDSEQILRSHMSAFHPEEFELFKEELDEMVRAESKTRRELRLRRQTEVVA